MSATPPRSARRFFLGFGLAALLVAGLLSYLADSNPDGLDSVTLRGCTETASGELRGSCIAQQAEDHPLSDGVLADYAVAGNDALTGVAGVAGVLVTLGVSFGLFWLVRRRPARDHEQG